MAAAMTWQSISLTKYINELKLFLFQTRVTNERINI